MKINDQFDPHLANILQPSKANAFTLISAGLNQYNKDQKIKEAFEFNKKLKTGAEQRADRVANADIDHLKFGQELDKEKFNFDKKIKTGAEQRADRVANANINYNEQSLGLQKKRLEFNKKSKTSSPIDTSKIEEINKKLAQQKREIVRTGTKDGKKVIQYSDGSIEYGS
jgi:hypothetical protein